MYSLSPSVISNKKKRRTFTWAKCKRQRLQSRSSNCQNKLLDLLVPCRPHGREPCRPPSRRRRRRHRQNQICRRLFWCLCWRWRPNLGRRQDSDSPGASGPHRRRHSARRMVAAGPIAAAALTLLGIAVAAFNSPSGSARSNTRSSKPPRAHHRASCTTGHATQRRPDHSGRSCLILLQAAGLVFCPHDLHSPAIQSQKPLFQLPFYFFRFCIFSFFFYHVLFSFCID